MRNDQKSQLSVAEPAARASILVVEDEFLIRVGICDELREAGHVVIEAGCAAEAMAILESSIDVDLIFSDVRMPGAIDGLGLLAEVRISYPLMPVIITSGHMRHDTNLDDGTDFLSKPYDVQHVVDLIQNRLKYR